MRTCTPSRSFFQCRQRAACACTESWAALSRVLTTRRLELLHHVRHHEVPSVRALAKALDRDYSNVHADVRALAEAGLLDLDKDGVRADYDAIETRVAI